MKLFQIEEPDGAQPVPADGIGAAVGIWLGRAEAAVAIAVGGNAELLRAPDGEASLALGPGRTLAEALLALRERAEKALARPVTHAVIATSSAAPGLAEAATAAGLTLLTVVDEAEAARRSQDRSPHAPALGAAIMAEDAAPRPSET